MKPIRLTEITRMNLKAHIHSELEKKTEHSRNERELDWKHNTRLQTRTTRTTWDLTHKTQ